jgi:hypothetical protein
VSAGSARLLPSFVAGWRAAAARPSLIAVLWCCHGALAVAAALPVFQWLSEATATSPAADVLATRLSFGLLAELLHYNDASILDILRSGALGVVLVGLLASPFLLAVTLVTLEPVGAAGVSRAPAAAAAALYWRYFRVLVLGRGMALLGAAATGALLGEIMAPLHDAAWEPGRFWAVGLPLASAALVALLFWVAVDYALIVIARSDSCGTARAWLTALRMVLARPALTLGLWGVGAVMFAAVLAAYIGLRALVPGTSAWLVGLTIAMQQLFVVTRTWLRVGVLGAEQIVAPWPQALEAGAVPASAGPEGDAPSAEDVRTTDPVTS